MEYKAIAVRRKYEGDIEGFCVFQRLLHPRTYGLGVVLGLNQRQRDIRLVVKHIVSAFALTSADHLAAHNDAAFRKADFFPNLRHFIPTGLFDRGRDKLRANVAFT